MADSYSREFYDSQYYAGRDSSHIDPYLRYILLNRVVKEKSAGFNSPKILDVGCGRGVYVDFFRKNGFKAWGIDFSKEAAKISQLPVASALKLPFKDGSFDILLSIHMIEHLNPREAVLFFAECRRVLKKDGRIFIMTPNGISPGRLIAGKRWFPDPSHINIYNPFRLSRILKKNGFIGIKNSFLLPINHAPRKDSDIVEYYGLEKIFRKLPFLQDLAFFFLFCLPFSYFRDVIYVKAQKG